MWKFPLYVQIKLPRWESCAAVIIYGYREKCKCRGEMTAVRVSLCVGRGALTPPQASAIDRKRSGSNGGMRACRPTGLPVKGLQWQACPSSGPAGPPSPEGGGCAVVIIYGYREKCKWGWPRCRGRRPRRPPWPSAATHGWGSHADSGGMRACRPTCAYPSSCSL